MKKLYFKTLLIFIALTFSFLSNAAISALPGQGTEDEPFLINDYDALKQIANDLTAIYSLTADINASASANENDGAGWVSIGTSTASFTGKFYGHGHVIKNLFINRPLSEDGTNVGLFGFITGSVIDSVGIVDANITGFSGVGALVGYNKFGTVSASYSTGLVNGDRNVGGLIGFINAGITTYCYSSAKVSLVTTVGGGLVGSNNYNSTISFCSSTGSIKGTGAVSAMIGGLVGFHYGAITNSFCTSDVSGFANLGGLAGSIIRGSVENSFCVGKVNGTGQNIGGFAGLQQLSTVTNSYWDLNTSGLTLGVIGVGKTTAELKTMSTFTNWDFDQVWKIDASLNSGYPYLAWQPLNTLTSLNDVKKPNQLTLRVYPTVVKSFETITIQIENLEQLLSKETTLSIYTVQGKVIYKSSDIESVNKIQLPFGQYFGCLENGSGEKHSFKVLVLN